MALILSSLSIFRAHRAGARDRGGCHPARRADPGPGGGRPLLGRKLFWPSKKWQREPEGARFARIGDALGRRPGRFAAASGLVLAVLAIFALQLQPELRLQLQPPRRRRVDGGPRDLPGPLRRGSDRTDAGPAHLRGRLGSRRGRASRRSRSDLEGTDGVSQVYPAQLSEDETTALVSVILDHDPVSDAALEDVKGPIRTAAHDVGTGRDGGVRRRHRVGVRRPQGGHEPRLPGGVPCRRGLDPASSSPCCCAAWLRRGTSWPRSALDSAPRWEHR